MVNALGIPYTLCMVNALGIPYTLCMVNALGIPYTLCMVDALGIPYTLCMANALGIPYTLCMVNALGTMSQKFKQGDCLCRVRLLQAARTDDGPWLASWPNPEGPRRPGDQRWW